MLKTIARLVVLKAAERHADAGHISELKHGAQRECRRNSWSPSRYASRRHAFSLSSPRFCRLKVDRALKIPSNFEDFKSNESYEDCLKLANLYA